jgi:putative addiction module component (TIGR02574 family)
MDTETILKEALAKPPADRGLIIRELIASLDPPGEDEDPADVEAAWLEEIARRVREVESGAVQTIPWETARDRVRKAIHGPR